MLAGSGNKHLPDRAGIQFAGSGFKTRIMQALWWQQGVVYQVYPRSFQDSDGDGVGDLRGIISRLDYLQWFGVDAIWISPIYPSPMADFGYDISNYTAIHPLFGSMGDLDELLTQAHQRNIRLILDLVPNHSSDQHPWFTASRSSRQHPKRDWYIWKDPAETGHPPNNWLSVFGGSAWEWDENTGQYYYHAFLKEQPDLNWRNPEVAAAIFEVMRFWLDKGIDGFRVDVLWYLIKDQQFRDNPVNPHYRPDQPEHEKLLPVYSTDQPEVHGIVQEMRRLFNTYTERVMIGEIYLPIPQLVSYYGENNNGAHLPFNFLLVSLPWQAREIAAAIDEYEAALPAGGWPNWVLSNHDRPRIASRVGAEQARVAAILLLTLRGTPTIYYGDEIGMADVPIPVEEIRDPQGLNMPDKDLSRDPARTPMQWSEAAHAGFTAGNPWLPVDRAYRQKNVAAQQSDPRSLLLLYKRLIALRRQENSLHSGNYLPVRTKSADDKILAYIREGNDNRRLLIILNLSHGPVYFRPLKGYYQGSVLLSASGELENSFIDGVTPLAGDEGIIVELMS